MIAGIGEMPLDLGLRPAPAFVLPPAAALHRVGEGGRDLCLVEQAMLGHAVEQAGDRNGFLATLAIGRSDDAVDTGLCIALGAFT